MSKENTSGYDKSVISCYFKSEHLDNNEFPLIDITQVTEINVNKNTIKCDLPNYIYENSKNFKESLTNNSVREDYINDIKYANFDIFDLKVYLNINSFIQPNSKQIIKVYPINKIYSIYPLFVHFNGSSNITVRGNNFYSIISKTFPHNNLKCKFIILKEDTYSDNSYTFESIATVNSLKEVKCLVPDISYINISNKTQIKVFISHLDLNNFYDNSFGLIYAINICSISSINPNNAYMHKSTNLIIQGSNFLNSSNLRIKFEFREYNDYYIRKRDYNSIIYTPLYINSSTLQINSPFAWQLYRLLFNENSKSLDRNIYVLVSNNGYDYIDNNMFITLYYPPIMYKVVPNFAFQYVSSELKIYGDYFNNKIKYCYFGKNYKTSITIVSPNIAKCKSPLIDQYIFDTYIQLISEEDIYFDNLKLEFKFIQTFYLSQSTIFPDRSNINGNIKVKIKLPLSVDINIFYNDKENFKIYFGINEVLSYEFNIDEKVITVINPPHSIQEDVNVYIKYHGNLVNRNIVKFYYYLYDHTGLQISPSLGFSSGGTLINVKLNSTAIFNYDVKYSCSFKYKSSLYSYIREDNNMLFKDTLYKKVRAQIIDNKNLNCISPFLNSGIYSFNLDYDDVHLSTNNIDFYFYDNNNIIDINPPIVELNSNCNISLLVSNIIDNPLLSIKVQENIIERQDITVIKPLDVKGDYTLVYKSKFLFQKGEKYISVSNNSQDYSISNFKHLYAYDIKDINIINSYPKHIPYNKNGKLTIKAKGLLKNYQLKAKININPSYKSVNYKLYDVDYIDDTTAVLNYPIDIEATKNPEEKFFLFTYNDCDFINISNKIELYPDLEILEISPRIVNENTFFNITITANNVWDYEDLSVKFINVDNLYNNIDEELLGYPVYEDYNVNYYDESLRNTNIDYNPSSNNNISYKKNNLVTNKSINVYEQHCNYLNNNVFRCSIPLIESGKYFISFTQNKIDYSDSYEFYIAKNPIITGVNPKTIPNNYQNYIIVYGENFYDYSLLDTNKLISLEVMCLYEPNYKLYENNIEFKYSSIEYNGSKVYPHDTLFQKTNNDDNTKNMIYTANGLIINENMIKCSIPNSIYFKKLGNVELMLKIKLYKDTLFSESYGSLLMFENLETGMTVDELTGKIIPCYPGYYCNSNLNLQHPSITNEKICLPGTYSDKVGSALCKPCPIGFVCKAYGTVKPTPVRRGTENTKIGMYSESICPKGSFCSNNILGLSKITNLFNYKYYVKAKESCKEGTYCIKGTFSGIVDKSKNYYAKLCTIGNICPLGSTLSWGSGGCPSGYYCPNSKDSGIPCPSKFYCPLRSNIRPYKCPKGTYNNRKYMHFCIDCPQGYYCPYEGLFEPIPCSAGYICETKKTISPFRECDGGRICLEGTKVRNIRLLCELRDYKNECSEELYYRREIAETNISSEKLLFLGYIQGFHKYICCLRPIDIEYMFTDIDIFFNAKTSNNFYSNSIKYSLMNYKFVTQRKIYNNDKINGSTLFDIIFQEDFKTLFKLLEVNIELHQQFLLFYFKTMYNNLQVYYKDNILNPITYTSFICPRKYYCLRGTATNKKEFFNKYDYSPKSCIAGTYCMDGAYSPIGTNMCPPGYNCPPESDQPSLSITQTLESKLTQKVTNIVTSCYAGYFTTGDYSNLCIPCPDGYECEQQGTNWPTICKEGMFRSNLNICSGCPKGTYSFQKGTKNITECMTCPPGTVCANMGTDSVAKMSLCPDGRVCGSGTPMITDEHCPSGYYCVKGTSPETKYKNSCDEGYICDSGTGESNKRLVKCSKGKYCPKGTTMFEVVTNCPRGTGPDNLTGLIKMQDCIPKIENIIIKSDEYNSDMSSSTKSNREYLFSEMKEVEADNITTNQTKNKRILQNESSNIINNKSQISNNEILDSSKTSYDNDYFLKHNEIIDKIDLISLEFKKFNDIPYEYTYNDFVKPVFSVNPLNRNYGLKPIKEVDLKFDLLNNVIRNSSNEMKEFYYFLPRHSYVLITFDLRQLINPQNSFIYGKDWDICFYQYSIIEKDISNKNSFMYLEDFIDNNFKCSNDKKYCPAYKKLEMPEQFLDKGNSKAGVHEFIYYTTRDVYLKVLINFYNGLFVPFYTQFINSAIIEWQKPNRVNLGKNSFYYVQLTSDILDNISFPVNLPMIDLDMKSIDNSLINKINKSYLSYNSLDSKTPKLRNKIEINRNTYKPSSLYWNNDSLINIPYIPFISNCKGYGRYIYLWALLENHNDCILVSEENTIYLSDISFGKEAKGDTCNNVEINCIYDEVKETTNSINELWFNAPSETELFLITVTGKTSTDEADEFEDDDKLSVVIGNENDLEIPGYPKEVYLSIFYYQLSSTEKKIVSIELTYSTEKSKITPYKSESTEEDASDKNIENNNSQSENESVSTTKVYNNVEYKLLITYKPYSHTNLMIKFALSYTFYIALYCVQGLAAIIIIIFFLLYTKLMSRVNPIPKFRFLSYIPLTLPPLLTGFFAAMFPIWIVTVSICLLMSGNLIKFKIGFCYNDPDKKCYKGIFSDIVYLPDNEKDPLGIEMGRVAVAMVVFGVYLFIRSINLMLPNEKLFHQLSYDWNFWKYFSWKRANFYFIIVISISCWVYTTFLSYSDLWGSNIWVMIYTYKIVGIIFENLIENLIDDTLLKLHIPLIWGINQGLFSFGADDLLDFLITYFVELASLMLERTYIEIAIEWIVEKVPETYNKIKNYINKTLKYNVNLDEYEEKKEDKDDKNNDEIGDDAIDLSSSSNEESSNEFEDEDIDGYLNKNNNQDLNIKNKEDNLQYNNENKEISNNIEINDDKKSNNSSNEDNECNFENVENLLDKTTNYTADLFNYFFSFYMLLMLWVFYYETGIFVSYGIRIQDFIYYLFFSIVIIPFNVISDYLFQNLIEFYDGTPIHDFYDYMRYRFRTRRYFWALDEVKTNFALKESSRNIEKLCYSSQYYFLLTICVTGAFFIQTGIVALIQQKHNFFGDIATLPITIIILIICYITEEISIILGKVLGLWQMDNLKFSRNKNRNADDKDYEKTHYVVDNSINDDYDDIYANNNIIPGLKKNWDKINFLKQQEDQMDQNLRTERLMLSAFRKKFINENKKWVQNLISELLTPRTLVVNKDVIIKALETRYGHKSPNISFESVNKKVDISYSQSNSTGSSNIKQIKYDKFKAYFEKRCVKKETIVPYIILEIWKRKAKLSIELFDLVKLSISSKRANECLNCGSLYLLRTFSIDPILDVFNKYVNHYNNKQNFNNYDKKLFREFFLNYAKIITLCARCEE